MKAREKRRRRALRQQRKRCEARLVEYWDDCVGNGFMVPASGGIPCPPKWTVAKSVINPAWTEWHAEVHAGLRAICLGCGKAFEHHELTTGAACSYLCFECADRFDEQMNDPEWWGKNGPKE